mmetsp:Transcript_20618/g.43345  ORF Transcript_20618/g.43345 Transcript_20618/m.43345 type:complete len:367 (+) Transcript_20618:3583-4683(+)
MSKDTLGPVALSPDQSDLVLHGILLDIANETYFVRHGVNKAAGETTRVKIELEGMVFAVSVRKAVEFISVFLFEDLDIELRISVVVVPTIIVGHEWKGMISPSVVVLGVTADNHLFAHSGAFGHVALGRGQFEDEAVHAHLRSRWKVPEGKCSSVYVRSDRGKILVGTVKHPRGGKGEPLAVFSNRVGIYIGVVANTFITPWIASGVHVATEAETVRSVECALGGRVNICYVFGVDLESNGNKVRGSINEGTIFNDFTKINLKPLMPRMNMSHHIPILIVQNISLPSVPNAVIDLVRKLVMDHEPIAPLRWIVRGRPPHGTIDVIHGESVRVGVARGERLGLQCRLGGGAVRHGFQLGPALGGVVH